MSTPRNLHRRLIAAGLASLASAPVVYGATFQSTHTFTVDDVQGGFDGSTFPSGGNADEVVPGDPAILCDWGTISPACPEDGPQPIVVDEQTTLYPIDSEFGFYVVDFVGGFVKERDGIYTEGWIGNYSDDHGDGVMISNAATELYKAPRPLGGWCTGMGGNSVKCKTEHYTVMEHVLTCHEKVPYFYALDPDFTCPDTEGLDDELEPDPFTLVPNESNLVDIAVSDDYSVTMKDDGKFLYRWGTAGKRPNDVRLYAQLDLPPEWQEGSFQVTEARLEIRHWITNNPNDQVRPEDMENEGAIGRKPERQEDPVTGDLVSTKDCYEGDGDFIPMGTILKNNEVSLPVPPALSEDLFEGWTNGWYTTIDRDPFEWSYDADGGFIGDNLVGALAPNPDLGELVSGPRWRLRANKFGQDIPGLEIPKAECSPLPFASNNIKYEVGSFATTVINLLDWEEGEESPLVRSDAWVDATVNDINIDEDGDGISVNGLPLTDEFDLAVYVKGDRKPTVVYDATLHIEYEQ